MCASGVWLCGADELREEREEEDRELRIQQIDEDGGHDHLTRRARALVRLDAQRAVLAERGPREVEQVHDAGDLERVERDLAGLK